MSADTDSELLPDRSNALTSARVAMRAGDIDIAHGLALDAIPSLEDDDFLDEEYVQSLHLLADTLTAAGEYDDARQILQHALDFAGTMHDGPSRDLHHALLHIALADLTLVSHPDLTGKDVMKTQLYPHTSMALDLLDGVTSPKSRHCARFFAFRTVMVASLIQKQTHDADFMRMQMDMQANSASLPQHLASYYEHAMAIATAYLDPNAPTVDTSVLYEVPPLSAYVPMGAI